MKKAIALAGLLVSGIASAAPSHDYMQVAKCQDNQVPFGYRFYVNVEELYNAANITPQTVLKDLAGIMIRDSKFGEQEYVSVHPVTLEADFQGKTWKITPQGEDDTLTLPMGKNVKSRLGSSENANSITCDVVSGVES